MKYIIEVYTRDKHQLGFIFPFLFDKKLANNLCKRLNKSWPHLECIPTISKENNDLQL
jgi:hypothetical protein